MAVSTISDLYSYIRAALGDLGIYDDDGVLISNTFYWQNAHLLSAVQLVVLDTSTYSISSSVYITPAFTNNNDMKFIIYSAALILLLPERTRSIKTPHYSKTIDDMEMMVGWIYGQLDQARNNGLIPYAKDGSLQHLENLATRWSDQQSGITDPDSPVLIPNGWIEVRNEEGTIVLVDTDLD